MRPYDDPASMSADERFRELARILAAGVLRLPGRSTFPATADPHPAQKNLPESVRNCLELSPKTRLSVHTG
jgi:hypothetical protein